MIYNEQVLYCCKCKEYHTLFHLNFSDFITHFLRYVVGIGVVECVKYSYNIHIEVRGCLFNQNDSI